MSRETKGISMDSRMDMQGFFSGEIYGGNTHKQKAMSRTGNDIDNKLQNIYFMF